MGRVKNFDHKAVQNRARVQKHRNFRKLKNIHEKIVNDEIYSRRNDNVFAEFPPENEEEFPNVDKGTEIKDRITHWAIHHRISKTALNDLLAIFIFAGFSFLPKDSRTLMRTPVNVPIDILSNGKMWYCSIQKCLQHVLTGIQRNVSLTLDFNFDGLPIAKSSNKQFWPILSSVREFEKIQPMVVGIWYGESKPILSEYLAPLVAELGDVISNGMFINGFHIKIKFGRVSADTPARSFVKGVGAFNSKNGCQKCVVHGEYSKTFRRMSFPNIDSERRTNASFRNRSNKEHHKETSPLEKLDIDMIYDFPSSDTLHLLDLGVMKRCMIRWVFGEKGYIRKWNKNKIESVSRLLEICQKYMPNDIHRAVRNLNCLRKWKGLEFRTILLYGGMVVFKDVLDKTEYYHFLLLCCAVRICSAELYKDMLPIAEKMFRSYVKMYITLYGNHCIGSNIHLLAHIVEDMKHSNVGNIMEISTYKYENCLRLLGLTLKHGHLPLEQVSRRILESMQLRPNSNIFETKPFSPQMSYADQRGSTIIYNKIQITSDLMLTNRQFADSWFLTKNDDIVKFEFALNERGTNQIGGMIIANKSSFFVNPIASSKLKIFISDGKTNEEIIIIELSSISAKMICLPYEENFLFMPLVHSLDSKF